MVSFSQKINSENDAGNNFKKLRRPIAYRGDECSGVLRRVLLQPNLQSSKIDVAKKRKPLKFADKCGTAFGQRLHKRFDFPQHGGNGKKQKNRNPADQQYGDEQDGDTVTGTP